MLLHGEKLGGPSVEVIAIPRQGKDIIFRVKAILDYSDFEKLFPRPKPPMVMKPGGVTSLDPTDKGYIKKVDEWATARTSWMILTSLSETDGLKWETIEMPKPETWGNYEKELEEAGFTDGERVRIIQAVISVNGLDQSKIDEATQRFLAGQAALQDVGSSPDSEAKSMPSGEPASVSV